MLRLSLRCLPNRASDAVRHSSAGSFQEPGIEVDAFQATQRSVLDGLAIRTRPFLSRPPGKCRQMTADLRCSAANKLAGWLAALAKEGRSGSSASREKPG